MGFAADTACANHQVQDSADSRLQVGHRLSVSAQKLGITWNWGLFGGIWLLGFGFERSHKESYQLWRPPFLRRTHLADSISVGVRRIPRSPRN